MVARQCGFARLRAFLELLRRLPDIGPKGNDEPVDGFRWFIAKIPHRPASFPALQLGRSILPGQDQRYSDQAKQVGDPLANVGRSQASTLMSLVIGWLERCAVRGGRQILCDSGNPAEQSFRNRDGADVGVSGIDRSQHAFADPAARIPPRLQTCPTIRKTSTALSLKPVAGIQTEGRMLLFAAAGEFWVHRFSGMVTVSSILNLHLYGPDDALGSARRPNSRTPKGSLTSCRRVWHAIPPARGSWIFRDGP